MKNLPGRGVLATLIVSIAVLSSTAIVVYNKNSQSGGDSNNLNATGTTLIQLGNDLSGTSTNWLDSLVANGGTTGTSTKKASTATSSAPKTVTDALSRDLFAQFATLETTNTLNTDTTQNLVDNLISTYDQTNQEPVFGRKDIVISSKSSIQDIKKYANLIPYIEQTRLNIALESIKTKTDPKMVSTAYRQIAADLKQVSVPWPLADLHLAAINNYEKIASSLNDLANYQNDPVKGLFALKQFGIADANRTQLYTQFAAYFKQSGIIFDENEPGYAWHTF